MLKLFSREWLTHRACVVISNPYYDDDDDDDDGDGDGDGDGDLTLFCEGLKPAANVVKIAVVESLRHYSMTHLNRPLSSHES